MIPTDPILDVSKFDSLPPGHYVGLDIGGSKTALIIVDQAGQQIAAASRPTDTQDPDSLVTGIAQAIRDSLDQAGLASGTVRALGVGVPGLVSPATGQVDLAVNLNLSNYPLGPALADRFGVPCALENDVRAATWGAFERQYQIQPLRHLAYLSIGTGIAAGVVLDGRLYRGSQGMAGEIGHVIAEPEGQRCRCGQKGCLEAVAAGPAIARLARERGIDPSRGTDFDASTIFLLATGGHRPAQELLRDISHYWAWAIQLLIMAYDVDHVALGGGVTKAGDVFRQPLFETLDALRKPSPLARQMLDAAKITVMPLDFDAGLWGAVSLAFQAVSGR